MAKIKALKGSSWEGQIGEFVREEVATVIEDGESIEKVVAVVAKMAGARLVEFKPEHVEHVADEPAAAE